VSTTERIAIGDVASVTLSRFDAVPRLAAALIVPDRPRAIDRYIDYFGGRAARLTTRPTMPGRAASEAVGGLDRPEWGQVSRLELWRRPESG